MMKAILSILLILCFFKAECQPLKGSMQYVEKTLEGEKTNVTESFEKTSTWLNGCSDYHFKKISLEGNETDVTILIKINGKAAYRKVTNIEGSFSISSKEVDPIQNTCKIYVIKDKKVIMYHEIGISGCN